MASTYQLIGAEHSYYTGKVRSYLIYKGVPFQEVLCTKELYSFVVRSTGVAFIPVLVTPCGETVQDTSDIIDHVEARFPTPSIHPTGALQRTISYLFELYADEWLVIPAMHYRWSFLDRQRSYIEYEWGKMLFPDGSKDAQLRVARKSMKQFYGSLPVLGINKTSAPIIEAQFHLLLETLDAHFAVHSFLLGEAPCLGDFALMGPLYAHLYRDPVPGFIMKTTAPRVAEWVERMNGQLSSRSQPHEVQGSRIVRAPLCAGFLDGDAIPSTLSPVLNMFFQDQVPALATTVEMLDRFKGNPEAEIPRVIGIMPFVLGGTVCGTRGVFPFNVWMLQRLLDGMAALSEDSLAVVHKYFSSFPNGAELLSLLPPRRVTRVKNRLHFEPSREVTPSKL